MRIRYKLLLIVIPLTIAPIAIGGVSSSLSTRNAITAIAREAIQFKAEELQKYAWSQWNLLVENDLQQKDEYIQAAEESIKHYADGLVRSDTELFAAVEADGSVRFSTAQMDINAKERERLAELYKQEDSDWLHLSLGGIQRVGQTVNFEPLNWMFLVTEQESTFYKVVQDITRRTIFILVTALIVSVGLMVLFTRVLLQPLRDMNQVITGVINSGDLSRRVPLQFRDEIGDLGYRFNIMTEKLQDAYGQIKRYAYRAVVARMQERKIRNIFQKYVPLDVLEEVFEQPEAILKGDKRKLVVLFSDIRGFTAISESLSPEDIVESLNRFFSIMVEIIMDRNGIVDKYIGDAIMAFFGAPVKHENDPEQATLAALEMLSALKEFNRRQTEMNSPQFTIGIGLNFGDVTIGNIGSDRKMDYTVIGDMVNLASRLEGLTKVYHTQLLISDSVAKQIYHKIHCRLVDRVRVKGKQAETRIYTPQLELTSDEKKGWKLYNEGLRQYYSRNFSKTVKYMQAAGKYLKKDYLTQLYIQRAVDHIQKPPPEEWDGVVSITEK